MIDLTTWLRELGVIALNPNGVNNQYEFFRNMQWSDGTFTHNQLQFFEKIGMSRYEFFKQYINEREFYRNTNIPTIKDFKTFYEQIADVSVLPAKILNDYIQRVEADGGVVESQNYVLQTITDLN